MLYSFTITPIEKELRFLEFSPSVLWKGISSIQIPLISDPRTNRTSTLLVPWQITEKQIKKMVICFRNYNFFLFHFFNWYLKRRELSSRIGLFEKLQRGMQKIRPSTHFWIIRHSSTRFTIVRKQGYVCIDRRERKKRMMV